MNHGTKRRLLAGCATAAIYCASCAPVDHPSSENEQTTAQITSDDSVIELLPSPSAMIPNGLRERIDAAIQQVQHRDVQVSNGFWTVSHGILGLGPKLALYDPEASARVNALDYICSGGEVRGMRFIPTKYGLDVQNGPMFVGQGHADQFVAEMVQAGLSPDHEFVVHGKQYTLMDFIRHTQSRVRVTTDQELSWAIVAIGQCLGTDISWTNSFDEQLHFEDLVRYELAQNVEEAACGGTHSLFGLSWIHQLHLRNGGQESGVWKEVVEKTARYHGRVRALQNPDGSFSTNFFRERGDASDMKLRINTTGHMLEWLALSLTDEQLQEPWVQRAANALSLMILDIQDSPMEGGTLYHAVHALRLYRSR
ncbi:MAG: hypothetical protein GY903_07200 [Fuerstiella sp.]|nr:hypothetical protein [Fuerstiella sp.]MCP4854263.1 hypothetical protein [Fuerstiella sp.]